MNLASISKIVTGDQQASIGLFRLSARNFCWALNLYWFSPTERISSSILLNWNKVACSRVVVENRNHRGCDRSSVHFL